MPPPVKKPLGGLGAALIRDQRKSRQRNSKTDKHTTDEHTNPKSLWDISDMATFFLHALQSQRDFTAERGVTLRHGDDRGNLTVTAVDAKAAGSSGRLDWVQLSGAIELPSRPPPSECRKLTKEELREIERGRFHEWRTALQAIGDAEKVQLTPYEKSLPVWRELWRVIDRSDLVLQIVDARNPLAFRSQGLERLVTASTADRPYPVRTVLVLNKADLLTQRQREIWRQYFDAVLPHRSGARAGHVPPPPVRQSTVSGVPIPPGSLYAEDVIFFSAVGGVAAARQLLRVIYEHKALLEAAVPERAALPVPVPQPAPSAAAPQQRPFVVGLTGYPNVGKSSTVNSLLSLGSDELAILLGTGSSVPPPASGPAPSVRGTQVRVSETPGKTKHMQTMYTPWDRAIMLADCPGLIFPSFATSKADLVVDGVLPVAECRDLLPPATLILQRVPQALIDAAFGLARHGETAKLTAQAVASLPHAAVPQMAKTSWTSTEVEEVLGVIALSRGHTADHGRPDVLSAARSLIRQYISGRIVYVHPPPTLPRSGTARTAAHAEAGCSSRDYIEPLLQPVQDVVDVDQVADDDADWESDDAAESEAKRDARRVLPGPSAEERREELSKAISAGYVEKQQQPGDASNFNTAENVGVDGVLERATRRRAKPIRVGDEDAHLIVVDEEEIALVEGPEEEGLALNESELQDLADPFGGGGEGMVTLSGVPLARAAREGGLCQAAVEEHLETLLGGSKPHKVTKAQQRREAKENLKARRFGNATVSVAGYT